MNNKPTITENGREYTLNPVPGTLLVSVTEIKATFGGPEVAYWIYEADGIDMICALAEYEGISNGDDHLAESVEDLCKIYPSLITQVKRTYEDQSFMDIYLHIELAMQYAFYFDPLLGFFLREAYDFYKRDKEMLTYLTDNADAYVQVMNEISEKARRGHGPLADIYRN